MPAQASVAPPPAHHVPAAGPDHNEHVMFCLFNANKDCMGPHFDASGTALAVMEVYGSAGIVIVVEGLAEKYSIVAKVVQVISRGAPIYNPVDGKCVGVWDPYSPLEFGSCTSKHGIYWQQHFTNKARTEFELYNTYTKDYMVVPGGKVTQHEWIEDEPLKSGEYHNWGEYTPDAG